MKHMSGIELAQELRKIVPELPLIGLSSIELQNGKDYFDYYTNKPIDANLLFSYVLNCLAVSSNTTLNTPRHESKKRTKHSQKNLKILVAEDDVHNSFTIKEMLINLGFNRKNIILVENGKECLEEVKNDKYHVVLMDIIMPIMDGIEAAKYISLLPNPPMIIAVSASAQPTDKTRCQRVGIDGYISKPILKEDLMIALSPLIKKVHKRTKPIEQNIRNTHQQHH